MFDTQRASILKRVSAFLLDIILISVLATGFAWLISIIVNYDAHSDKLNESYNAYYEAYGIDSELKEEEYNAMTDEEKDAYDQKLKAMEEAMQQDKELQKQFSQVVSLTLLMVSLGIFFAYIILEFAVPLILKNGQTLGKKVFSLAVMRVDGVKVTPFMMFVRTLLGKYTVETMIPVAIIVLILFGSGGIIGITVLGMLTILQIGLFVGTHNHTPIHDLFAQTVVVDLSSQIIFDTEAEMIEAKKQAAQAAAERKTY